MRRLNGEVENVKYTSRFLSFFFIGFCKKRRKKSVIILIVAVVQVVVAVLVAIVTEISTNTPCFLCKWLGHFFWVCAVVLWSHVFFLFTRWGKREKKVDKRIKMSSK